VADQRTLHRASHGIASAAGRSLSMRIGPADLGPAPGTEFRDTESVTNNPYDPGGLNEEQLAERQRSLERARHLAALSDTEVIAFQPGPSDDRHLMEMSRRLKEATNHLAVELVTFRASTESAANKSEASANTLERLTRWLIGFTLTLVVLTVAVVVLTAALAAKG
jgi:hypothetical protein